MSVCLIADLWAVQNGDTSSSDKQSVVKSTRLRKPWNSGFALTSCTSAPHVHESWASKACLDTGSSPYCSVSTCAHKLLEHMAESKAKWMHVDVLGLLVDRPTLQRLAKCLNSPLPLGAVADLNAAPPLVKKLLLPFLCPSKASAGAKWSLVLYSLYAVSSPSTSKPNSPLAPMYSLPGVCARVRFEFGCFCPCPNKRISVLCRPCPYPAKLSRNTTCLELSPNNVISNGFDSF